MRSINRLKQDLDAEQNPGGSLIQGPNDDIVHLKGHVVEAHHVAVATLFNINEAVEAFKDTRGTQAFHQDAEYCTQQD